MRHLCLGKPGIQECEEVLPGIVLRASLGEGIHDGKAGMVGINCASEIALGGLRIADSAVRNRKVALPSRIGRIGFGQRCDDGQSRLIRRQRVFQIAGG